MDSSPETRSGLTLAREVSRGPRLQLVRIGNLSSTDPSPLVRLSAPEVGQIPGSTPKPTSLNLEELGEQVHEYGPTAGILPLRQAVADYYNREFRQDKPLKYAPENICIVPVTMKTLAMSALEFELR